MLLTGTDAFLLTKTRRIDGTSGIADRATYAQIAG
jgi:hypothetical protein